MLAESTVGTVVDITAGKTAQMLDAAHRLAKHGLGRRLQAMALEQGERHRQRATGEKAAAQGHVSALHTQNIAQGARRISRCIGLAAHAQTRGVQHLVTQRRIVLQTTELVARQQVGAGPHIQGRPGVPLGRHRHPTPPDGQRKCTHQHQQHTQCLDHTHGSTLKVARAAPPRVLDARQAAAVALADAP